MINTVHGKKLYICQWTGESIQKRFRIPTEVDNWAGCYGSPSVALAALIQYSETSNLTPDQTHELIDEFEASVTRWEAFKDVKFTITVAPSYMNLEAWGGSMSLEEYHKSYDHDTQVKMYHQRFPKNQLEKCHEAEKIDELEYDIIMENETEEEEEEESLENKNAPKKWKVTQTDGFEKKVTVPRGLSSCLEFLRSHSSQPNSCVIYFHKGKDKIFGVGKPDDWTKGAVNRRLTNLMGHTVFGETLVFHKNDLREKKK